MPSKPKCTDMFRITRAEPWAMPSTIGSLFSFKPKLRFQITQCPSWTDDSTFPIYNIWSPAYFGVSLPQPDAKTYELSRNDLVVTGYEADTTSLKSKDSGPIPFEPGNVSAGIDVDYPGFLTCGCCFRYRGCITLSNGERWEFSETDMEWFHFQRYRNDKSRDVYGNRLLWERYQCWEKAYGERPEGLPFTLDKDTRICRVSSDSKQGALNVIAPVIAVMNREGVVFVDGLEKADVETANLRELVLMASVAVRKYELPKFDK